MAVTSGWYVNGFAKAFNGEIDLDTHTIKCAGTTSAYTPSSAHDYFNDVTNEVTGTGYTAGGDTVTVTASVIAANSWATARANSTAYVAGDVVRPATGNGFLYQAITGGTSGGSIPTYPTTIGGTVTDGSVVWECVGTNAFVFNADDPQWNAAGGALTIRKLVFYRDTGTASTSPLIAWVDLGGDVTATNDTWTYVLDDRGVCFIIVP